MKKNTSSSNGLAKKGKKEHKKNLNIIDKQKKIPKGRIKKNTQITCPIT
jgi:hypothetical protein